MKRLRVVSSLLLCALAASAASAHAAGYTFIGSSSLSDWGTSSNFTPGGVPGAGDTLFLTNATGGLAITGTLRTILNLDTSNMSASQNLIANNGVGGTTLNITGTLLKNNAVSNNLSIRNSGATNNPLSLIVNHIELSGLGNLSMGASTTNPITAFTATSVNISSTGLLQLFMLDNGTAYIQNLNMSAGSLAIRNVATGTATLEVNSLTGSGGQLKASNSQVGSVSHLNINNSGSSSFSGTLTNGATGSVLHVRKTGSGVQTLASANNYTGTTTVSAGRLQVTNSNGLGFGGAVALNEAFAATIVSSGTLDLSGNLTVNEVINLNDGSLINSIVGTTATHNNGIAGVQFTNSGSNYINGAVTITGGGGTGATATSVTTGSTVTSITLTNGGTGFTDASTIVITKGGGGTGFAATAVLSSLNLTGTGNNIGGDGNMVFSATVGGSGGFVKVGTGTATLNAASNSYSGKTDISAGTLVLSAANNNIANSTQINVGAGAVFNVAGITNGFTLASGQALTGSGTIVGALTVGNGATFGPGNSPGTMTFNNNLAFADTSTSNFEINGLTSGLYDLAQGGSGSQTVGFDGTLNLIFQEGFATLGTVKIFDFENYTGSFSDVNTSGLADGYSASFNALTGEVTVVPEPTTWALLGLGLGFLVLRARSRRRSLF